MVDITMCVNALNQFAKNMNRLIVSLKVFGINVKRKSINNNLRRYQKKPMYRKRALLKALKNRR